MSEMTEEKAREILNGSPIGKTGQWFKAEGYLERVAQEREIFGPLVHALNHILDHSLGIAGCPKNPVTCAKEALDKFYEVNPSWKK